MKTQLFAAAILLGSSHVALAADAVVDNEVVFVATADNWSGVYVGATIGYGWADTNVTQLDSYSFSLLDDTEFDFDSDGILGGAFIGYSWKSGNFVYGVEADISATDIENTVANSMIPADDESFSNKIDWFGTVRGRLGYAADRWMPYITGGIAFADVTSSYDDNDPGQDNHAVASDTVWGWTIGAGAEFAVTDNWTLRGEYLFVDLKDTRGSFYDDSEYRYDFDNQIHVVRLGAAYKF